MRSFYCLLILAAASLPAIVLANDNSSAVLEKPATLPLATTAGPLCEERICSRIYMPVCSLVNRMQVTSPSPCVLSNKIRCSEALRKSGINVPRVRFLHAGPCSPRRDRSNLILASRHLLQDEAGASDEYLSYVPKLLVELEAHEDDGGEESANYDYESGEQLHDDFESEENADDGDEIVEQILYNFESEESADDDDESGEQLHDDFESVGQLHYDNESEEIADDGGESGEQLHYDNESEESADVGDESGEQLHDVDESDGNIESVEEDENEDKKEINDKSEGAIESIKTNDGNDDVNAGSIKVD